MMSMNKPFRVVVLRRELIARNVNHLDLRFGRQGPAFEAIDPDHGSGPCHLLQLALHLVRIVR